MKNWDEIRRASTGQIPRVGRDASRGRGRWPQCRQDAEWHAEGDVWTHTRMVVAEVERLPEWPSLDRDAQLKLLFTALFHDAGKPATTAVDPATGRTHSPKHALAGMELGRRGVARVGLRPRGSRRDSGSCSLSRAAAVSAGKTGPGARGHLAVVAREPPPSLPFRTGRHARAADPGDDVAPKRTSIYGRWSRKKTAALRSPSPLPTITRGSCSTEKRSPACITRRAKNIAAPSR